MKNFKIFLKERKFSDCVCSMCDYGMPLLGNPNLWLQGQEDQSSATKKPCISLRAQSICTHFMRLALGSFEGRNIIFDGPFLIGCSRSY